MLKTLENELHNLWETFLIEGWETLLPPLPESVARVARAVTRGELNALLPEFATTSDHRHQAPNRSWRTGHVGGCPVLATLYHRYGWSLGLCWGRPKLVFRWFPKPGAPRPVRGFDPSQTCMGAGVQLVGGTNQLTETASDRWLHWRGGRGDSQWSIPFWNTQQTPQGTPQSAAGRRLPHSAPLGVCGQWAVTVNHHWIHFDQCRHGQVVQKSPTLSILPCHFISGTALHATTVNTPDRRRCGQMTSAGTQRPRGNDDGPGAGHQHQS